MLLNLQFPADFFTFTEEIITEELHFLCSGCSVGIAQYA